MTTSPLSIRKFRIVFIVSWLIVIGDHFFLLKWFGMDWYVSLADCLVNDLILLAACLLVFTILRYYLPKKEGYYHLVAWCIILTAIVILISNLILKNIFSGHDAYMSFLNNSLIIRISLNFLILGCVILISVVWFNLQEQQEQEKRKQDAAKLAREAELFKLRQQLQPHFLFNSLNSINALIGSRPEEARKMVLQLSDFLRGTIRKEDHQWVTLKEELQYLQLYLDIEKVRFGNRLSTIVECDDSTNDMKLPALLLQPIVENAIKFGLYDTIGEIEISINVTAEDKNLLVKVVNPFDPETSAPKRGTGFGLQAVQRRLYLLFGRTDLLKTEAENKHFTTIVKIPQA